MKTNNSTFFAAAIITLSTIGGLVLAQTPAVPAAGEPATGPDTSLLSSRTIEMKPTDKRPLGVNDQERNPYAKRTEEEEVVENSEDSQESRIRNRLLTMPVGGCSIGKNGRRILVGEIVLEKGRKVDPILPDQTENLKVLEISENEISFGWLDFETGDLTGKTMQIAYDLSPGVRSLLPGHEGEKGERPMRIIRIDEDRKRAAEEYKRINPRMNLPAGVYERAQ